MSRFIPQGDMTGEQVVSLSVQARAIVKLCERASWSDLQNDSNGTDKAQVAEDVQFALALVGEMMEPIQDALESHEGVKGGGGKRTARIEDLIEAYRVAVKANAAASVENGPEWDVYDAAERAVIASPCKTLEDVQAKARLFLADRNAFDTLHTCISLETKEPSLLLFLRSLLGGDGQ